jgi:hypothetical protein
MLLQVKENLGHTIGGSDAIKNRDASNNRDAGSNMYKHISNI